MNGKTRQVTGVFGFVLAMALGVMLALGSASNTAFAEQEGTGLGESLEDSGIVLSMADDADALTVDSELEDGLELVRSDEGEAITVEPQSDEVALEAQAAAAHVSYRTHVQSYGWQGLVRDGEVAGTSGRAKRLEGIELKLTGAPYPGGITYRTHVQGIGWQGWKSNGQTSGTSGQARRLEAIEIKLTGTMAQKYDVWYRVHAQTYGWMGWARNGARAGTATMGKRLEAIQVVLHQKGWAAPPNTYRGIARAYAPAYATRYVQYRTHVQSYGWRGWSYDGQTSGTSGQSKRLEAVEIRLPDPLYAGSVQYRTHVQTYGWQGWVADGATSGTSGQAKRLEAIQIKLTGTMAQKYDVWYRVHAQTFGWMGWARNGASAGTEGWAKRLEAIEVRITAKGSAAPGSTANAFRKLNNAAVREEYVKKLRELKGQGRTSGKHAFMDLTGDGIDEMIVQWWPSIYSFRGGSVVLVEHGAVMGSCSYGGAYLKKRIVLGLTPDHMGSSSKDYLQWNGSEFVNMASFYEPSAAARRNGYKPYYWIRGRENVSAADVQQYVSALIGNDQITRITYQSM